jgi:hypothetical protein
MTRKIACIVALLCALPLAVAQAQQPPRPPGAPPPGPKPTKADVQKVVQIINADKAKLANYCKLAAIDEQMAQAAQARDTKKLEELGKQGETLQQTLGPEYVKLTSGLEQVDPQSKDGQELIKEFEVLDKLCTK